MLPVNARLKAFSESEEGLVLLKELEKMAKSDDYITASSYSVLDAKGVSFVQKQMRYMSQYPNMNHTQYLSNLKMMTRRFKRK